MSSTRLLVAVASACVAVVLIASWYADRGSAQATPDWDAAMCAIVDPRSNTAVWFIGGRQGMGTYVDRGERVVWVLHTAPVPVFVRRMVTRWPVVSNAPRVRCVAA